jgi:uncharacterized protein DUF4384
MLYALVAMVTLTASASPDYRAIAAARHHDTPGVRLWISGQDLVRRGDRVRLFYRVERDAYVTVLRVDTDGRVRVLFPRSPMEDNYAYGGETYSVVQGGHGEAFVVDDDPGQGFLFAAASDAPFDYHALLDGDRWDAQLTMGGRVHGDPLSTLEEMVQQTLPDGYTDFDTHLVPYYVDQRYEYPRFVCYDCHAYTPYASWDPYYDWCPRFTLVVWRDPFYYYPSYWYPTWYYGGSRVVYVNPGSSDIRSRYVFKSRESSQPGIDYRDRRRSDLTDRRSPDRLWRGVDVGGVGSVPAPASTGRRTVEPRRRGAESISGPAWPGDRSNAPATAEDRRTAPDPRGDWRTRYYTPGDQGTEPAANPSRSGSDQPVLRRDPGGEMKPQQRLEPSDRRGASRDAQQGDGRGTTRAGDQGRSSGGAPANDRGGQVRSGGDTQGNAQGGERGGQVRSGDEGRRGASPAARPSSPPAASSPPRNSGSSPRAQPQGSRSSGGQSRPSNPGLVRRRGS